VIPVLTPAEMAEVDADAKEPVDVLIERAGGAVARGALRMLGGAYGKRVVIVAGKGNNGNDGRAAARRLSRRGVVVEVVDAADPPDRLPVADLVVDAAYGTGFRGAYRAPDPRGAPVLAVDIPSGVNGETGEATDGAVRADATVTFAALKPGLLIGDGPERAGDVELADIGLDTGRARAHVVEDADVRRLLPKRDRDAHKWSAAVFVLAGSPGMTGAALLSARAALRAGAGTVRLGVPGADPGTLPPSEVVVRPTPAVGFGPTVLEDLKKCKALVVGPGLGVEDRKASEIRRIINEVDIPVVIDADALTMLGERPDLRGRRKATVLTPHEGEFRRLDAGPVGAGRFDAVRDLAAAIGATVLLKGPTTIVSSPDGDVLASTAGGSRLATAGTGDVLSGIIGALLALGLGGLDAAGAGAHVHGATAELGPARGLIAGDLVDLLPRWFAGG
jgi:NAD(P)H-hydrate epimerase